jgi:hypothetical protein
MPTQVLNQVTDNTKLQSFGNMSTISMDGSSHSGLLNDDSIKADNVPVHVKPKTAGYVHMIFLLFLQIGIQPWS